MGSLPKQSTLKRLSITDIYWIAGLLEGEGCFYSGLRTVRGKPYPQIVIAVSMTDEDIIRRLHDITGIGSVYLRPPPPNGISKKHQWQWKIGGQNDIYHLLCSIVPLLGERRRNKVSNMIDFYQAHKPRPVEVLTYGGMVNA